MLLMKNRTNKKYTFVREITRKGPQKWGWVSKKTHTAPFRDKTTRVSLATDGGDITHKRHDKQEGAQQ